MATIDVENSANVPGKAIHAGPNIVIYRLSTSVTLSAGDVYRLGRIPHGIIPVDAVWYPGPAQPAGFVAKFGTSASQEAFFASATYSVTSRTTIPQGTRRIALHSLSDDASPRYDRVVAVPTAGVSVGHIGDLVVTYVLDHALG